MSTVNLSWYNTNESRDYPLSDTATAMSDRDERLPQNIVCDLRLVYPEHLGIRPFLSGVSVTPGAVSVLFQCHDGINHIPLGAVTVPIDDLQIYRPYPVQSQYPGVYGYVVFGAGTEVPWQGTFRSPEQGLLTDRSFRRERLLPVVSMGRLHQNTALTGLVHLSGDPPVSITKEIRTLDGADREAIVIRLVESGIQGLTLESTFQEFAGPCSGRPESLNCGDPQPVQFINTVGPDCHGTIEVEFTGCATVGRNQDDCSVVIDCGRSLDEACTPVYLPDHKGVLPGEVLLPEEPDDEEEQIPSAPLGSTQPEGPLHQELVVLSELPFTLIAGHGFEVAEVMGTFPTVSGRFHVSDDHESYTTEFTTEKDTRNMAVWDSKGMSSLHSKVMTVFQVLHGEKYNAGVVVNYRNDASGTRPEYYAVIADLETQKVSIQKFTNGRYTTLLSVDSPKLLPDKWYVLYVYVTKSPSPGASVGITAQINEFDPSLSDSDQEYLRPRILIGPLMLSQYHPDDGWFGILTEGSRTRFLHFEVNEQLA